MVDNAFRYLVFNLQLSVTAGFASRAIGGFSEVSGLGFESTPVVYSPGAGAVNHPRK